MSNPTANEAEYPAFVAWTTSVILTSGKLEEAKKLHAEYTAFATAHDLHFEPLPWSWYYPGGCLAGVYTRQVSA